jgi:hypothetical protein
MNTDNVLHDMKIQRLILSFLLLSFLSACGPSTSSAAPELVNVYSTSSAEPWLPEVYYCAGTASVINRVDDAATADIVLRVGEPPFLSSFAYQIDTEEILIVTHRQSPVQNLNVEGVRALFSGMGDPSLQMWVYAADADVQQAFDQFVMEGRAVSPSAMLAVNPQQMSDTLVNEPNTVGILPQHWKVGDSRFVYTIPNIPVLAITQSEPQGVIQDLMACLQK